MEVMMTQWQEWGDGVAVALVLARTTRSEP